MVVFSLFLDILFDGFFIAMEAYGVDRVSCRPELATPEELLDFRMFEEYLFCGDALGDLGNLGWQHHGYRLDEKVDVVFISADFHEVEVIRWRKGCTDFLEGLLYCF